MLRRGERGVEVTLRVDVSPADRLNVVEMERDLRRHRTIQASLHVGTPDLPKNVLPPKIIFTNSGNSRVDISSTILRFAWDFPEEEIDILVGLKGSHKLRLIQPLAIGVQGS